MKNMKRFLSVFLVAVAALPAAAQVAVPISIPAGARTVAQAVAEDGESAIVCKYIGTSNCASIAVDAGTGDLTFTDGTCGSEGATDTFECPVSGALGGVIDVSNGSCNTIGEVVDIVNASSDWRCQPYASLRADSSNDTLVTISATQATGPDGLGLKLDSSVALISTVVLAPNTGPIPSDSYRNLSLGPQSTSFLSKPWVNTQAYLSSVQALSTYGSGTSALSVIAVDRTFAAAGSETSYTVWPSMAGGATTVAKTFGSCDTSATGCDPAWGPGGLFCPEGLQCLVRLTNSAALSVNTIGVNGLLFPNSGKGLAGAR